MFNIGLDLDNTIINYNNAFYSLAIEKSLISKNFPKNKIKIREFLNDNKKDKLFTKLQAEAYGKKISRAHIYEGFREFISSLDKTKTAVFIVSHKTKYPVIGEKVNLHEKAIQFLKKEQIIDDIIIKEKNIFFEDTIENKINRINKLNLDLFIDDLPRVLKNKDFSKSTKKILIDYEGLHNEYSGFIVNKWSEIFAQYFK
jgi:hypothetical protein